MPEVLNLQKKPRGMTLTDEHLRHPSMMNTRIRGTMLLMVGKTRRKEGN